MTDDLVGKLRGIIETATSRLGKRAFKELAGEFWGFIETRPYMRARDELVSVLHDAGRLEEAAKECEEMLELNPNDNQGVRDTLLMIYLRLNKRAEAKQLVKRYDNDVGVTAVFTWSDLLLRCLVPRKSGLEKALAAARGQNPHIEAYITGAENIPRKQPPHYSYGSREEAVIFADELKSVWSAHPKALDWLRSQEKKDGQ